MSAELVDACRIPSSHGNSSRPNSPASEEFQHLSSDQEMKFRINPANTDHSNLKVKENVLSVEKCRTGEEDNQNLVDENPQSLSACPEPAEHARRVSNSTKKKPTRKRRVTANLAATKYEVGKFCIQQYWEVLRL